ncbi:MAG: alpha/beta fold hydrolase [Pseudomonadota bacterium]
MHPLFFGTHKKQLFGVYHPPATPGSTDDAVLLCAPIANEYIYTHRALKQFAARLANAGFHTFRFDYYATGDSAGEETMGEPAQWVQDIFAAAEELRAISGCRRVDVVGLRLGATLAMQAMADGLQASRLVIWDPVVNGRNWLRELSQIHKELLSNSAHSPGIREPFADDLVGFVFPATMQEAINQLDMTKLASQYEANTIMLTSQESTEYDVLKAAFSEYGGSLVYRYIPDAGHWLTRDMTKAIIPFHIPQAIITTLKQRN